MDNISVEMPPSWLIRAEGLENDIDTSNTYVTNPFSICATNRKFKGRASKDRGQIMKK